MLPAGWHVTELHQTDMLQFELFVEAEETRPKEWVRRAWHVAMSR